MKKRKPVKKKAAPIKLTYGPFHGITIDLTPQEKLSFVPEMEEHFLSQVLKHPEALITDESRISDFGPWGKNGDDFRKLIVKRVMKVYGVDIDDIYDEPLPAIFQYIQSRKTK
jgi:hypothetical protein